MLDRALRPLKDRLLVPLARPLGRYLSPATLTFLSVVLGLGAGWLAFNRSYGAALVAWLLSRVLDGLDGTVARVHHRQSDFGGYIDIVGDFVVYAAIPICLVLGCCPTTSLLILLSFLLATYFVNAASWMYLAAILEKRAAGAAARGEQTTVAMPDALVGGTETIVFYSVFILMPGRLGPLMAIFALLVALNVAARLVWASRILRP